MGDTEKFEMLTGIAMGMTGGVLEGSIQMSGKGLTWKRSGGGRTLEIPAEDIKELMWSETPGVGSMGGLKNTVLVVIRQGDAGAVNFLGFPKSKLDALRRMNIAEVKEKVLSVKGNNWGHVEIDGGNVVFMTQEKEPAFVLPLSNVLQAQHGRDEVGIQLPFDDTAGDRNDDMLAGMTFHVPKDCEDFPAAEDAKEHDALLPASRRMYDVIKSFTVEDVGVGDAIATFDSVAVQVPRGRFDIEMYPASLHLVGPAHDFRVQYQSILRIFVLPRANAPQSLVVIALDPPIRRGQTTYTMVLCQFHNDEEMSVELQLSDEALKSRNDKGAKLSKEMIGPSPDIFARTLRGLSGAKLTRTGAFRDATGEGHAVRCSYKNDDGHLYPLERAFFYLLKPPLLIPYDEIKSIEFLRQSAGVTAAKTFDLLITMNSKGDDFREQQYLFRSIPRSEWTNLFEWIRAKELKVENLKEVQKGPSSKPTNFAQDVIGAIDQAIPELGQDTEDEDDDEDHEDEDFDAGGESDTDGDESEVSDEDAAAIVAEDHVPKRKSKSAGDGETKERKKRKKKDKNAPKKSLTAFMFFSNVVREQIKSENPGIPFTEVAKKIGEKWKELTDEDKRPYEAQAEADKKRYEEEMTQYRANLALSEAGDRGEVETVKKEESDKFDLDDDDGDNIEYDRGDEL